ncbi:MAG: hypothetical protein J6B29_05905 [Clostridia bacterium]|nr:hypothetical protein [Clostridia bacterium]
MFDSLYPPKGEIDLIFCLEATMSAGHYRDEIKNYVVDIVSNVCVRAEELEKPIKEINVELILFRSGKTDAEPFERIFVGDVFGSSDLAVLRGILDSIEYTGGCNGKVSGYEAFEMAMKSPTLYKEFEPCSRQAIFIVAESDFLPCDREEEILELWENGGEGAPRLDIKHSMLFAMLPSSVDITDMCIVRKCLIMQCDTEKGYTAIEPDHIADFIVSF